MAVGGVEGDVSALLAELQTAQKALQQIWQVDRQRQHLGNELRSIDRQTVANLIQRGQTTADSLKGRAENQSKEIQDLVDSISAFWMSYAEHMGWDPTPVLPTPTSGMSGSSFYLSPSRSHGSGGSPSRPQAQSAAGGAPEASIRDDGFVHIDPHDTGDITQSAMVNALLADSDLYDEEL